LVAAHQQFGFENNFQFVRRPARTVNKSHRFPTELSVHVSVSFCQQTAGYCREVPVKWWAL
jgi:hypothetical protein